MVPVSSRALRSSSFASNAIISDPTSIWDITLVIFRWFICPDQLKRLCFLSKHLISDSTAPFENGRKISSITVSHFGEHSYWSWNPAIRDHSFDESFRVLSCHEKYSRRINEVYQCDIEVFFDLETGENPFDSHAKRLSWDMRCKRSLQSEMNIGLLSHHKSGEWQYLTQKEAISFFDLFILWKRK
jgi:hypothetical protein